MFKKLKGALGVASELTLEEIQKNDHINLQVCQHEKVLMGLRLVRDLMVITDHRLIMIDIQGVTGKKVSYISYPYAAITVVSVETAGHLDLDGELKISLSGHSDPVSIEVSRGVNVHDICKKIIAAKCGILETVISAKCDILASE